MAATPPYSNKQVQKAGRVLRKTHMREIPVHVDTLVSALDVVRWYRAQHQYALSKATMGLRSFCQTRRCDASVSQRLKRMSTITDKLVRHPTMSLTTMQDIGGCRAVFRSIQDLYAVADHIDRVHPPITVDDYVRSPKESGYRAVHMVVAYTDAEGIDRMVEVQLRTSYMHQWAVTLERFGDRINEDLKSGGGSSAVLTLFALISQAMALQESGRRVDESLDRQIATLRVQVLGDIRGRQSRGAP